MCLVIFLPKSGFLEFDVISAFVLEDCHRMVVTCHLRLRLVAAIVAMLILIFFNLGAKVGSKSNCF